MTQIARTAWSAALRSDRRHSPRLQVLGQLHGHVVPLGLAVDVVDISLGGLSIKSAVTFPIGAVHRFRLTLGDGAAVDVNARAAYCRLDELATGEPRYLTGFAFVEGASWSGSEAAGDLIDRLTSTLSFDVQ